MKRNTIVIACVNAVLLSAMLRVEAANQFDGRQWIIGYDASDSQQHITEYVLPGQTVEAWRELITHQVFFDPQHLIPIKDLVRLTREGFGADCKGFRWKVLRENEAEAVYAWSHSGCSEFPPQYEVSRLAKCTKGICRWGYSTKEVPISLETQKEWRRIVEELVP